MENVFIVMLYMLTKALYYIIIFTPNYILWCDPPIEYSYTTYDC